MKNNIIKQIENSIEVKRQILSSPDLISKIEEAANALITAYRSGNKTLLAGNGGSAGDAQHIAGELVNKFCFDRPGIASIALTTDSSILTAIGNDYGYSKLFERQVQALGMEGDVFIGISTSGRSENIMKALVACRRMGITTIGLTGEKRGKMDELCDICINVPSKETPRIQESHILIGHIICGIVEEGLFGELRTKS